MNSTYLVPFCHSELTLIDCNGEPYVAMRPIVEGMGLTWKTQYRKIQLRFASTVVEMTTVAQDGKSRTTTPVVQYCHNTSSHSS